MPTPWPHPCPVMTNVADPAGATCCTRAGAAPGTMPRTRMKASTSDRRIERTPARTRPRLAEGLISSRFLYRTLTTWQSLAGEARRVLLLVVLAESARALDRLPPVAVVA